MIMKALWKYLTTSTSKPSGEVRSFMKQSLEASVTRACSNCGAKGVDRLGRDVGENCPDCGAKRPTVENLGVIWEKY